MKNEKTYCPSPLALILLHLVDEIQARLHNVAEKEHDVLYGICSAHQLIGADGH